MTDSRIICGDALTVLKELPKAAMVFADPPDNIGLKYDGHNDDLPKDKYLDWLGEVIEECTEHAVVIWFSVNAKWQETTWYWADKDICKECRLIIWYFTFGQHRESDCGNNYRPIFRIAPKGFVWHTDRIKIPSERQRLGDKRANPEGRVPGDVWGGPADIPGLCRVQGNNKERRKWHPTQHPEKLLERCILMSTNEGDLVIDPFGGTFTTLRVCQRLNRHCISIEISEEYCRQGSEETGVPVERIRADQPLFAGRSDG